MEASVKSLEIFVKCCFSMSVVSQSVLSQMLSLHCELSPAGHNSQDGSMGWACLQHEGEDRTPVLCGLIFFWKCLTKSYHDLV